MVFCLFQEKNLPSLCCGGRFFIGDERYNVTLLRVTLSSERAFNPSEGVLKVFVNKVGCAVRAARQVRGGRMHRRG